MNLFALDGLAGLVVDTVLKGTLFLSLLLLANPLLRRLSAGTKHLIWGTALVALVALPFVSHFSPWRIGVLPAPEAPKVEAGAHESETTPRGAAAPTAPTAPTNAPTTSATTPTTGSEPVAGRSFTFPFDLGVTALTIWAVGFVLVLIRLAAARRSAQKLLATARSVEGKAWNRATIRAADHLGLPDLPALRVSEALPLPITLGIRHPAILLPEDAEEWPEERRSSVLLHEMAHIRRRDVVTHLLGRLACAVWWFHPLAWKALTNFRLESERAADDLVLAAGRRASEYAQDLLAVVQQAGRAGAPIHSLAMAQRSDFEGRLLAILEPGASRRGVTPMTAIPVVLAVSLVAFPLAALGPAEVQVLPTPTPMVAPNVVVATPPVPPVVTSLESQHRRLEVDLDRLDVDLSRIDVNIGRINTGQGTPKVSSETMQALVEALRDEVPEVRRAAANSLAQVGDTTVVAALIQALASDTDDGVRRASAWALGQLEHSSAVPALSTALRRDRDIEVRRNSAWALGEIEDASAVDALTAVLTDPDRELRQKAVWALGQIEDVRALPGLLVALRDTDAEMRSQAAWALGQIESKDAVEGLSRAVGDSSREVRSQVAWALGQIEDAAAVPALIRLLRDPVAGVRKQAAWALGQVESSAAVEPLGTALRDSDAEVRSQAAWALGQIEDQSSVAVLVPALRDQSAEVRRQAAWAIGQVEPAQIPPALIAAFEDGDAEMRKMAAWAAGQIEDPAAIIGLTKLLSDANSEVQHTALWALGQIDDPRAMEGVTRLLRSNDAELRRMAAEALGRDH
jgi:HEAT repeat protein/beta-lactamase regulating signal transducer with metallopeptidase domain